MPIFQQLAAGAGVGLFVGVFTGYVIKNRDIQAIVRVGANAIFGVLLGAKAPYAFGISAVATLYFGVLWERMSAGNPFGPSSKNAFYSSMTVGISAAFSYLFLR